MAAIVVDTVSKARDIVQVYNRYLVELIVLLKGHGGQQASKVLLAARHRAIDASSDTYIRFAIDRRMPRVLLEVLDADADILDIAQPLVATDVLLKGVALSSLTSLTKLKTTTPDDARRARSLLHLLATLASAHAPEEPSLEKQTLAVIGRLQKPTCDEDRSGAILDGVLEDDVRRHLDLVRRCLSVEDDEDEHADAVTTPASTAIVGDETKETGSGNRQDDNDDKNEGIAKMLEDSKLGALAREMLADIDPEALEGLTNSPPTAFDFAQIADGTSPIGSIVQKAGSKLVSKLTSGELNKDELIGDVMKMLGAFGGGAGGSGMPTGMADMMSSMTGLLQGLQQGGGGGSSTSAKTTTGVPDRAAARLARQERKR